MKKKKRKKSKVVFKRTPAGKILVVKDGVVVGAQG